MKPRNRNVPRTQEKNPEAHSWSSHFSSPFSGWLSMIFSLSLSQFPYQFSGNSQVQREEIWLPTLLTFTSSVFNYTRKGKNLAFLPSQSVKAQEEAYWLRHPLLDQLSAGTTV